jgi:PAS domain S-box-containing protein
MKPDLRPPNPNPSGTNAERGFEKAILRLVKGGPERLAIEAGEIDAIVDRASGTVILLPEAQRALIDRKARFRNLVGLSSDWYWEQDEHYRFVARAVATVGSSGFGDEDIIGKALWELSIDNMSETDWQTHHRQLEWRATFRDLEVRRVDRAGAVRYLSLSGEPIFDDRDQFKGYRGITRDITERKQAEAVVQEPNRFARATLDALAAHVGVLDAAGVVLLANKAWRAFAGTHAGIGAGVFEGANYLAACDNAGGNERVDGIAIAAGIRQVIAGERELFRYDHASDSPAGRCWLMLSITGVAGDTAARAVVSREDITELKRGELLLGLEHTVARTLADADNATAALKTVIRAVCEAQGWDCGRYFRLDQAAGALRYDESWGVPAAAVSQILEKSRGLVFRLGAGLTGRVCQSGQPLWVLDGMRDTGVSPTALAPETGGEGAFVFPVMSEDKTIGVLAFSSRIVREPDDRMLQAVRSIGSQLGRFLQRQQALDTMRRSAARFRRLTELSSDWYWEQDSEFRFTQFVGCGVLGAGEVIGKTRWELPNIVLSDAQWAEHKSQLAAQWSFCDFEFAAVNSDGQLGYYCISGEPVYDEAGAFTGYCGTGLDITKRKRAEIALRESEARLRALAGLASD